MNWPTKAFSSNSERQATGEVHKEVNVKQTRRYSQLSLQTITVNREVEVVDADTRTHTRTRTHAGMCNAVGIELRRTMLMQGTGGVGDFGNKGIQ